MVAGKTYSPIRGRRMRITRLDECGVPVTGPASTRVSKGFVSVGMSPKYETSDTITVKNAAGEIEFNEPGVDTLVSIEASIAFTKVDPDLFSLITGQQTVVDGSATAVGLRLEGGAITLGGWALEVWSDLGGQACLGSKVYGYFLLPFLRGGTVDNFSIESGSANFTIKAITRENPGWGVGPYNVIDTSATQGTVTPGKLLTAVGPKTHFHLQETTIAPPAESAGLVPLP